MHKHYLGCKTHALYHMYGISNKPYKHAKNLFIK